MWYFFIRPLAKTLLASIRAALASGPKQGMPMAWSRSTHPRARGSSGATTAKSMAWDAAKSTMASMSRGTDLRHAHRVRGDAAVARQGVDGLRRRILFQLFDDGVLPASAADHEKFMMSQPFFQ